MRTYPAAADYDTPLRSSGLNPLGHRGGVVWIIVIGFQLVGAQVNHLVPGGIQPRYQQGLQLVSAVVGGDGQFHFPAPRSLGFGGA